MRIGFDVDGVLADFIPAYQQLAVEVGQRDTFVAGDDVNPPCWNWPEHRGYTKAEMSEVWRRIKESDDFWISLPETADCSTLRMCILDLLRFHDVYFITSRVGSDVKWQSEQWLMLHLGIDRPTVLISSAKGLCCKALKLDCYLDDNLDNVNDVVAQTIPDPLTRTYLLDKSYNQSLGLHNKKLHDKVVRVSTLGKFLDYELVDL
jgi:hypothetical protein